MRSKGSGFFWPSFTDLMTSLFFIMLVLYVLTYLKLKNQQVATERELNKIKEIQAAAKELPPDFFAYDSVFKRFSLKRNIEFITKSDILKSQDDQVYLLKVGRAVKKLVGDLKVKYATQDIKYVIIIEGMASRDNFTDNYPLSYKRAWAVLKLWQENNILFDQAVCEIQIAGSGTGGIGRFTRKDEEKNQRILIQIVPKIGNLN